MKVSKFQNPRNIANALLSYVSFLLGFYIGNYDLLLVSLRKYSEKDAKKQADSPKNGDFVLAGELFRGGFPDSLYYFI